MTPSVSPSPLSPPSPPSSLLLTCRPPHRHIRRARRVPVRLRRQPDEGDEGGGRVHARRAVHARRGAGQLAAGVVLSPAAAVGFQGGLGEALRGRGGGRGGGGGFAGRLPVLHSLPASRPSQKRGPALSDTRGRGCGRGGGKGRGGWPPAPSRIPSLSLTSSATLKLTLYLAGACTLRTSRARRSDRDTLPPERGAARASTPRRMWRGAAPPPRARPPAREGARRIERERERGQACAPCRRGGGCEFYVFLVSGTRTMATFLFPSSKNPGPPPVLFRGAGGPQTPNDLPHPRPL